MKGDSPSRALIRYGMNDSKKDENKKESTIKWRLKKLINALLILFPHMNEKQKKETLEEIDKTEKNLEE